MKDLKYWKNNAEEDYITTPISVLRYITELEKVTETKPLIIGGVGSTLCSCDSLEAKPKTDMSQPYECAKCDKPIYKN